MSRVRLKELMDLTDPTNWGARFLFWGMKNDEIAWRTSHRFSGGDPEGTHPVLILRRVEEECYEFCPCSSKEYNHGKASYIRKGAKTPPCTSFLDRNSYILHFLSANLCQDDPVAHRLALRGVVEREDIVGAYHEQRRSIR